MRRIAAFVGLSAVSLWLVGTQDAAVFAPRTANLTFVGTWSGHTRSLQISRTGVGRESIGAGCCDPVIDLRFRLSRAAGTRRHGTATIRLTYVRVRDPTAYSQKHPPPRVGETGRLVLRNGVITESLTQTTYCDARAARRGVCGA